MLFFDGGFGLIMLAIWIFCIIDVITTPDSQIRNLPKLAWLMIVILLADIGSIAWLVAGRNWSGAGQRTLPYKGNIGHAAATASPTAARRATNPDDDEEFLAGLRARAEEQRRRAREQGGESTPPTASD